MGRATVTIRVRADTKNFQRAMKRVSRTTGFSTLTNSVKNLGAELVRVSKYAAGLSVALGGVMVKHASDLEQSTGAVKDVFKTYADTVNKYSKSASRAVGLSSNSYNELAILIGSQLKNGGTAIDQLAGKTNQLINLGADLAAGFGGSTREAIESISSALKGERDPIEKYGVTLKQAAIDAEAAALGFTKVGGSLSAEATQAATLSLIMKQTSDFHGKFGDESDTLANKMQVLKAKLENMAATIGSYLIPAVSSAVTWIEENLQPVFEKFANWLSTTAIPKIQEVAEKFKTDWLPVIKQTASTILSNLIPAVTGLIKWLIDSKNVIIPLVASISSMVIAWRAYQRVMLIVQSVVAVINIIKTATLGWVAATQGMTIAQRALNLVMKMNPIGLIVAAITGLVATIGTLWVTNENFRNALIGIWDGIKNAFQATIDFIVGIFNSLGDVIATIGQAFYTVGATIGQVWSNIWRTITSFIGSIISSIGNFISRIINFFFSLPARVGTAVINMKDAVVSNFKMVIDFFKSVPSKILSAIGNLGSLLSDAGRNVIDGFVNGIKSVWNKVKDTLGRLTSWLPSWKGPASVDKKILRNSGRLVIGGFIDGLEDSYKSVHRSLNRFTNSLDASINLTPNLNIAGAPQSGNTYNINISALTPTPEIGRQIVRAISDYENAGGRKWR